MLTSLSTQIRSLSRTTWFGVIAVSLTSSVAGTLFVPGQHASAETRVSYAIVTSIGSFIAVVVLALFLKWLTSPLRHWYLLRSDARLGQRCIALGYEIYQLMPMAQLGYSLKDRVSKPRYLPPPSQEEIQRVACGLEATDTPAKATFYYHENGLSARVFRVSNELKKRDYISDAQLATFRTAPQKLAPLMEIATSLVTVGIQLGATTYVRQIQEGEH